MEKTRITIETTQAQKMALDAALRRSGLTLPEWFDSQIDDFTLVGADARPSEAEELKCLGDLDDAPRVLEGLKAVDWGFADEDTGYLSHDIHPYPAKFIPQIPHHLITRLSLRGELVYDPFGGCGTTALEAILLGRRALSTDIHPLAKIIGEAKTLTLTKEEEDEAARLAERLMILSRQAPNLRAELAAHRARFANYVPQIPNLSDWFHERAVEELAYLRWRIESLVSRKVRTLAKAAFSKSVVKASYQDGETRYARKPREVGDGFVVRLFAANFSAAAKKIRVLGPMLRFREAAFETLDLRLAPVATTRESALGGLVENSVDLIVTSPPYPNATDYHLYHRFRLFWLGFDPRVLARSEIGSHLRHQKEGTGFDDYMEEMKMCMDKLIKVLRPGRYAVIVLGDAVFRGRVYNTCEELSRVVRDLGFQIVGAIGRTVHTTKRSFISPARRVHLETLLVLRKPPASITVELIKAPYKLWPYEEELRLREVDRLLGVQHEGAKLGSLRLALNCLSVDKLRRLTFTHAFRSDHLSQEATWQATLENGDALGASSQRKDPKYATHGIHAYKGKFYPQLAKCLFNLAQLQPGQRVIDPFCGSGTVLLEAHLNGLSAFGVDLNPLAVKIARVKTQVLEIDPYIRDRHLALFTDRLSWHEESDDSLRIFPENLLGELVSWFPRPVLRRLGWLLGEIQQVPEPRVRDFLEVVLSSLVREVSQQEPKDLRIRRRHTPLPDAPVYELFRARLNELRLRLQQFAERSKFAPNVLLPAEVVHGDCRAIDTFFRNGIGEGSFDALVTSPPYATALPYIDTDRLSILLLLGLNSRGRSAIEASLIGTREINRKKRDELDRMIDGEDFEGIASPLARSIIREVRERNCASDGGFRKQNTAALLYTYFRDMSRVLQNLDRVLREGASAFFVIGDNKTVAGGKEIRIESALVLQEIGLSLGWRRVDTIPITVTTENRFHVKNSITQNKILWFQKQP
jgi:DNA modification methylase